MKYASFTTMVNEIHMRRKIFTQHSLKGVELRSSITSSSWTCRAALGAVGTGKASKLVVRRSLQRTTSFLVGRRAFAGGRSFRRGGRCMS